MLDERPGETAAERQALMLAGYLRWQIATVDASSRLDPLPDIHAAARVALAAANDISPNPTNNQGASE